MDKLFSELGLEYLADRRWMRRLSFFYKIMKESSPSYLHDIIPKDIFTYKTRVQPSIRNLVFRTNIFANNFFPYTIRALNNLGPIICTSSSQSLFKKSLLNFIRPSSSCSYDLYHPLGIKLLTRLRLGLSHLPEHKFRHNFRNTINPLCSCNNEPQTTIHFLLHCLFFLYIGRCYLTPLKILTVPYQFIMRKD